jgi:hypothetical protein
MTTAEKRANDFFKERLKEFPYPTSFAVIP